MLKSAGFLSRIEESCRHITCIRPVSSTCYRKAEESCICVKKCTQLGLNFSTLLYPTFTTSMSELAAPQNVYNFHLYGDVVVVILESLRENCLQGREGRATFDDNLAFCRVVARNEKKVLKVLFPCSRAKKQHTYPSYDMVSPFVLVVCLC